MQLSRIVYRYSPFVNLHIIVRRNGFGSHSTVHTTFGTVEDTLDVSDNRLNEVPNKLHVDSTYLELNPSFPFHPSPFITLLGDTVLAYRLSTSPFVELRM